MPTAQICAGRRPLVLFDWLGRPLLESLRLSARFPVQLFCSQNLSMHETMRGVIRL